jgi:hypothetical protein
MGSDSRRRTNRSRGRALLGGVPLVAALAVLLDVYVYDHSRRDRGSGRRRLVSPVGARPASRGSAERSGRLDHGSSRALWLTLSGNQAHVGARA